MPLMPRSARAPIGAGGDFALIVARRLAPNESLICRKETFLCAEKSVN